MTPDDGDDDLEAMAVKALIKNNFEKQFPAIIKVVVKYANSVKGEYQKVVT